VNPLQFYYLNLAITSIEKRTLVFSEYNRYGICGATHVPNIVPYANYFNYSSSVEYYIKSISTLIFTVFIVNRGKLEIFRICLIFV